MNLQETGVDNDEIKFNLKEHTMKNRLKAFTLIELLVVITIIGILAGLAVPAINGGLDKAKQAADISNIRNLGIILFSSANDNNGSYPVGTGTTKTVFEALATEGAITDGKILSSNGYTCNITGTGSGSKTITAGTYAWGYGGGTTTTSCLTTSSDDRYVLLCSQGYDGTGVEAPTVTLVAAAKSWTTKGVTVYTKGNSAKFSGAGKGTDSTGTAVGAGKSAFGGGDAPSPAITIKD